MTPDEFPDRHHGNPRAPWRQFLVDSLNGLAYAGLAIYLYGVYVVVMNERLGSFEKLVDHFAAVLTTIGVVATAASVYLPANTRQPEAGSKWYKAPAVILLAVVTLALWFISAPLVHPHMWNGLAILGIAGGLFRSISR